MSFLKHFFGGEKDLVVIILTFNVIIGTDNKYFYIIEPMLFYTYFILKFKSNYQIDQIQLHLLTLQIIAINF